MSKTKKLPRLFRSVAIDLRRVADPAQRAAGDAGDDELYDIAISSEFEVERQSWFGDRWVEVLSHAPGAVDLRRFDAGGISFLKDHQSREVIGIVKSPTLTDGVLRGQARFSRSVLAQEVKQDIDDGIRLYTSVGYDPKKARMTEVRGDGTEVWQITLWQPMEVSSVAIPADPSVGVGRSAAREEYELCEVEIENDGAAVQREETMNEDQQVTPNVRGAQPAVGSAAVLTAPPDPRNAPAEIARMGEAYKMSNKVADWLARGLTADQVAAEILVAQRTSGPAQPAAETIVDLPKADRTRYSYGRAIAMAAEMRLTGTPFSGLEGEVHAEIAKRAPLNYQTRNGILVPMRLNPDRSGAAPRTRTMDSLTATKGTETVFDEPGELIELLRARAMVAQMGARLLTGLTAPMPFPKVTGGLTVTWMPENPGVDAPSSDMAFGTVLLAPHTLIGVNAYSRQLLTISSIDTEAMVRDELAIGHALAIDRAAIHGTGVNAQPLGVYNAPDVNSVAMGGNPTFGKLVDMIGLVADKNALFGSTGFMTTPLAAAKMKQTLVASAAGSEMIWTGPFEDGEVAGYGAVATNQVSKTLGAGANEHGLVYGNWADMIIGFWGVMELVVDPYTLAPQGLIKVSSFQMADIVLRHGESFTKATGVILS